LIKQAIELRFLGVEPSPVPEAAARDKAIKLDQFCRDLIACHVSIEELHKHMQQGRVFAVRVDVTLPGHEMSVGRVQDEDVYLALRVAFDDMERQVADVVRRMRPQETAHPNKAVKPTA
jgi:ribosome-associated translation inhibitor RaiA